MDHTTRLTGRTMLITGASSGIGAAIARDAVAAGMRVVLAARSLDRLEMLAAELGGADHAIAVRTDVTSWDEQQAAVAVAIDRFGALDAVVANAGFGAPRGFLESTPEQWESMVMTNVYGCALTLRATMPALLESTGHAVLTSSVAGRRVLPGSLYSCTKHAVTAMAEAFRQEVADRGVRVTSIEPGMTDTPFFDDGVPEWSLEPEDIARGVMFALEQPERAAVTTLTIRPSLQKV